MQSLDSEAIKLALGIPVLTKTRGASREAGILRPDEIRKLAAKHIIRNSTVANRTNADVELRSGKQFSKRANKNLSPLTIASYTSDLFEKTNEFQESC